MRPALHVFICSTSSDLSPERAEVLDAIRRLKQTHRAMEFFGSQPSRPIEVCLDEVSRSDILVVIVGSRYGSLVPGRKMSFSQAEYEHAHALGKPCLVYLRHDETPSGPDTRAEGVRRVQRLKTWKSKLSSRHTTFAYRTAAELGKQVTADIAELVNDLAPPSENPAHVFVRYSKHIFRHPAASELDSIYEYVLKLVGNTVAAKPLWTKRFAEFPEALHLLVAPAQQNGSNVAAQFCGLFTLLPLSSSAVSQIEAGQLTAMSMTNDLIDPLKPSGLYISILAAQNLVAGALLMQRLLDLCDTPWNRDLPIYARPARSPALPLMAKYGFTPVHLRPGNDPAVYKRTNIQ